MRPDPNRHVPGVRDARAGWPNRRNGNPLGTAVRWRRRPEPWEMPYGVERYPGATVLEDWELTLDDPAGTARVLARYAVIRVVLLGNAGLLRGVKLFTERRIATEHLALLPPEDWERTALRRVNDLCAEVSPLALPGAILVAAEAAAKRGHVMSAFAFFRTGHQLAMEAQLWDDAARAARGIARIARMDEARYSTRLWEWRATVLEGRAALELERRRAEELMRAAGEQVGGAPPAETPGPDSE